MPEFIHVAEVADVSDPGKILVEVVGEMILLTFFIIREH